MGATTSATALATRSLPGLAGKHARGYGCAWGPDRVGRIRNLHQLNCSLNKIEGSPVAEAAHRLLAVASAPTSTSPHVPARLGSRVQDRLAIKWNPILDKRWLGGARAHLRMSVATTPGLGPCAAARQGTATVGRGSVPTHRGGGGGMLRLGPHPSQDVLSSMRRI